MLDSASTHAMIAVKDLSRADEFYGERLGLKAADGSPGGGIRYETRGETWFLVYQSAFAGDREERVHEIRGGERGAVPGSGGKRAGVASALT